MMQYVKMICVGCNNIIFVEKNSRIDHKRTCPGIESLNISKHKGESI